MSEQVSQQQSPLKPEPLADGQGERDRGRTDVRVARAGIDSASAASCAEDPSPGEPPPCRREQEYPPGLARSEAQRVHNRRAGATHLEVQDAAAHQLPPDTVGLALSGGGIRSATFCLGVLQAMARKNLLGRVDLLSTVSGGGYVGSFLGRLFSRRWVREAAEGPVAAVQSVLTDTHSEPLRWLRDNGRYLSPNGAGDTWLGGTVLLRNLVALHVVLGTFVLGVCLFANLVRATVGLHLPMLRLEEAFSAGSCSLLWWSPWLALPALTLVLLMVPLGWAYWLDQVDTQGRLAALPPLAALLTGIACLGAWRFLEPSPHREVLRVVAALVFMALLWWLLVWCQAAGRKLSGAAQRRLRANHVSRWLSNVTMLTLGLLGFALVDSLGQSLYAVAAHRGLQQTLLGPTTLPPLALLAGLLALVRTLAPLVERLTGGDRWKLRWDLVVGVLAMVVLAALLTLTSAVGHGVAWATHVPAGNPGAFLTPPPSTNPTVTVTVEGTVHAGIESLATAPAAAVPSPQHTLRADALARVISDQEPCARPDTTSEASTMSLAWCGWGLLVCLLLSTAFGHAIYFLNFSSHLTLYAARIARAYLGASNPERWKPSGMHLSDVVECDGLRWDDYRPDEVGGPLHIVNLTVNETVSGTSRIEHRDRKGLPMAVGPCGMSVGSRFHGLWVERSTKAKSYSALIEPLGFSEGTFHALAGGTDEPHRVQHRCLEQWIAASGAAFTTGLGWRTSLGASLLLGLGNVRLGHWWDSHVHPSQRTGTPHPTIPVRVGRLWTWLFPVQSYLLDELLARFHGPGRRYWYLSDGGHFENTGCYELIRRRVPFIICCDCGADSSYQFEDLAILARRVRTDFGAELELVSDGAEVPGPWVLDPQYVGDLAAVGRGAVTGDKGQPAEKHIHDRYAVVARVRYPEAGTPPSVILCLKPSLTGDEPVDVLNYATTHPSFPQEPTTDQFFDEAQWESYRKLGEHIGDRVFRVMNESGGSHSECS